MRQARSGMEQPVEKQDAPHPRVSGRRRARGGGVNQITEVQRSRDYIRGAPLERESSTHPESTIG
jgi:hypothetical protein